MACQRPGRLVLGGLPVVLGFVLPTAYLVNESVKRLNLVGSISSALLQALGNTVLVAVSATVLPVACGWDAGWAGRSLRESTRRLLPRACVRMASLGYAVPGTVLAIGLLPPLLLGRSGRWAKCCSISGLLLMGSSAALRAGVCHPLSGDSGCAASSAGLLRIPPSLEQASRLLGESSGRTLWRVHLPLLETRPGRQRLAGVCGHHERAAPPCCCARSTLKPWPPGCMPKPPWHLRRRCGGGAGHCADRLAAR